ncbi:membrane protein [Streptomyces albospinus]|uniref:Membrane protein n=1 Tax=Streptomyces albospinus TaxID=285515 RepID=A0ABQ2VDI4_9ACTN|nr:DUF881 domain-containing protein [Streptomyces albospinus]GGU80793.1 membrane protein [Streptomyces albospinus]
MSNSADSSGRPARPRLRPVRLLTLVVFALAGLMFWLSFDTARGTNLRSDDSMLRLSDLIQERSHKNGSQDDRNATLRAQVDGLARRDTSSSTTEQAKLKALEKSAGLDPLSGQGVTVTLMDAPPNATAKIPGIPEPQPNDLVIHQQDLQAVVNALWHGGAKGIKVMDQRLISTSAVRCVGNTLILQGRVYSPPYKITAVGDRDALNRALTASPAIQNYLQYVNAYGLGWKVDQHEAVTLPGYSGTVDLHYAQPVKP